MSEFISGREIMEAMNWKISDLRDFIKNSSLTPRHPSNGNKIIFSDDRPKKALFKNDVEVTDWYYHGEEIDDFSKKKNKLLMNGINTAGL